MDKITLNIFPEFGYEMACSMPYAYWLHKQNKLEKVLPGLYKRKKRGSKLKLDLFTDQFYESGKREPLGLRGKGAQDFFQLHKVDDKFKKKELFANTIYILSNTNKLYFDYTFFKTYATPPIFHSLVEYIYDLIKQTIQKYNSYEIHINWNTYTISAHDRYKELYTLFLNRYDNFDKNFYTKVQTTMYSMMPVHF